jgi:hypothetical protein
MNISLRQKIRDLISKRCQALNKSMVKIPQDDLKELIDIIETDHIKYNTDLEHEIEKMIAVSSVSGCLFLNI